MVTMVAVVTRRLKEGKTYDDFRQAWFHTTGFGIKNRMFTFVNISDPREITVVGISETELGELMKELLIDVHERQANPLDEVIESGIGRKFGLLLSEDNFSAKGHIEYQPPSIDEKKADPALILSELAKVQVAITDASALRDRTKENRSTG